MIGLIIGIMKLFVEYFKGPDVLAGGHKYSYNLAVSLAYHAVISGYFSEYRMSENIEYRISIVKLEDGLSSRPARESHTIIVTGFLQ